MEDDNIDLDTPPSSLAASDADNEVKKSTVIEISNFCSSRPPSLKVGSIVPKENQKKTSKNSLCLEVPPIYTSILPIYTAVSTLCICTFWNPETVTRAKMPV